MQLQPSALPESSSTNLCLVVTGPCCDRNAVSISHYGLTLGLMLPAETRAYRSPRSIPWIGISTSQASEQGALPCTAEALSRHARGSFSACIRQMTYCWQSGKHVHTPIVPSIAKPSMRLRCFLTVHKPIAILLSLGHNAANLQTAPAGASHQSLGFLVHALLFGSQGLKTGHECGKRCVGGQMCGETSDSTLWMVLSEL